jgi:hypothetical protein
MKDLTWKHVVLLVSFFAAVVILSLNNKDQGAFIALGLGVFGALGLIVNQVAGAKEQTTAVKEQGNGNTSRMMDIIEAQGKMLALMQPVLPPAEPDATDWSPMKESR